MEKSKLKVICGLKIVDVVLGEGDAGISFENGINLAIYNRYELVGFTIKDTQSLIGNIVTSVDESASIITIRFENNWALQIDMRDEAYTGPEAMQLRVPGNPIVIWN
jgi:hypothetical protein